jgi:hypothetical protein
MARAEWQANAKPRPAPHSLEASQYIARAAVLGKMIEVKVIYLTNQYGAFMRVRD